jgi:hypothetical protein
MVAKLPSRFIMKTLILSLVAVVLPFSFAAEAQGMKDPGHIEIKVTPFYDSKGPAIEVGAFSKGLASGDEKEFVATIQKMKQSWNKLSFAEMYVAAIRLYDLGYRKEAVYWFYSAQYRGRLFGTLLDESKMGGMGAPGFELFQAQGAFMELVGAYINAYAFGDIDLLLKVLQRVQKEGVTIPDLNATYRGVVFKKEAEWKDENEELNAGLTDLMESVEQGRKEIKEERTKNGTEAKFSKLKSKEL